MLFQGTYLWGLLPSPFYPQSSPVEGSLQDCQGKPKPRPILCMQSLALQKQRQRLDILAPKEPSSCSSCQLLLEPPANQTTNPSQEISLQGNATEYEIPGEQSTSLNVESDKAILGITVTKQIVGPRNLSNVHRQLRKPGGQVRGGRREGSTHSVSFLSEFTGTVKS